VVAGGVEATSIATKESVVRAGGVALASIGAAKEVVPASGVVGTSRYA